MTVENAIAKGNAILYKIAQPSLTLEEEETFFDERDDDISVYTAVEHTLNERGAQGEAIEKLNALALLSGVEFKGKKKIVSNIFLGKPLE